MPRFCVGVTTALIRTSSGSGWVTSRVWVMPQTVSQIEVHRIAVYGPDDGHREVIAQGTGIFTIDRSPS